MALEYQYNRIGGIIITGVNDEGQEVSGSRDKGHSKWQSLVDRAESGEITIEPYDSSTEPIQKNVDDLEKLVWILFKLVPADKIQIIKTQYPKYATKIQAWMNENKI